ncbi:hypothetical protein [Chromobacterium aquaticum]|uniref:Sel1 repeat family protein n=1 Tax=Chromobacterium aquaticum TaxID=467180 RepID=A0ABV8ZTY6_9NEIS|nr:hypothetical protein [Chromobacterium aquaticum]MCD5360966.1 hypothetical protein [Chromobacterium aquaticum]
MSAPAEPLRVDTQLSGVILAACPELPQPLFDEGMRVARRHAGDAPLELHHVLSGFGWVLLNVDEEERYLAEGLSFCEQAADLGSAEGASAAGDAWLLGDAGDSDLQRSLHRYRQALAAEHKAAAIDVAYVLEKLSDEEPKRAADYLREAEGLLLQTAASAEADVASWGCYGVGRLYLDRRFFGKADQAESWLLKSAELGWGPAMDALAERVYRGKDLSKSLEWREKYRVWESEQDPDEDEWPDTGDAVASLAEPRPRRWPWLLALALLALLLWWRR